MNDDFATSGRCPATGRPIDRPVRRSAMRATLLTGIAALAGGCSGEPSAQDIREALQQQASAAQQQAGRVLGGAFGVEIHDVKKLGCESTSQKNAGQCDVEIESTVPIVGRTKQAGRIRLVDGDDGWIAITP